MAEDKRRKHYELVADETKDYYDLRRKEQGISRVGTSSAASSSQKTLTH
jgi:hypothetical protein